MSLYCPISVKFCTGDLHVLLLTDCDIVKTAAGKAVLLLWTYIQLVNGHTASVFGRFLYTGVHGGPIGRPRSAERVVILHTLVDRENASF
jgi:hypothetical protein